MRRPIADLVEALDSYDALDDVQRSLIERWYAGEDINDTAKFDEDGPPPDLNREGDPTLNGAFG